MDLHCHCSIGINAVAKTGRFEKGTYFGNTALARIPGLQASKKDFPAHVAPLLLMFIPGANNITEREEYPGEPDDSPFFPGIP
jgi:hypothetical protein